MIGSLFSLKGIFICSCLFAVFYFGWPIIEAIFIILPIPDPKDVNAYFISLLEWLQRLPQKFGDKAGADKDMPMKKDEARGQYGQDFE